MASIICGQYATCVHDGCIDKSDSGSKQEILPSISHYKRKTNKARVGLTLNSRAIKFMGAIVTEHHRLVQNSSIGSVVELEFSYKD